MKLTLPYQIDDDQWIKGPEKEKKGWGGLKRPTWNLYFLVFISQVLSRIYGKISALNYDGQILEGKLRPTHKKGHTFSKRKIL